MTYFSIFGTVRLDRAICGAVMALGYAFHACGSDWPQFRGPTGNGISTATSLPLTWSETNNIKWKTPIHGKAWSSPLIAGDRVWLTTATEDGRELSVVSVDLGTGKIVTDQKLFDVEKPQYSSVQFVCLPYPGNRRQLPLRHVRCRRHGVH
jgi:hypothetical protein